MPDRSNRPKDIPKRIPAWAWKRLRYPARRPQSGPHKLPRWFWPWRRWRLEGNPPLPKPPPAPKPPTRQQQVVAFCHTSLTYAGRMTYSMRAIRAQLFGRAPGDFNGAHADCSQFVATILHWVGVKNVTDTDYTGTLLAKGRHVRTAAAARVAVWGPGTGTHTAFITEKAPNNDWWTVGFGHQGGPDRVLLSDMDAYFQKIGKPGVQFLDFLD